MDSEITGLNKIICNDVDSKYGGKVVTVRHKDNTWTATVTGGKAVILVPSLPVPARDSYTISVDDFARTINIGYGEVIEVGLAPGYEPAIQKDVSAVEAQLTDEDTEIKFRFGIDENGRYGYRKDGADTVTPFRDGTESFAWNLGSARNIRTVCENIKNTYGVDIDYTKLTNNNFAVVSAAQPQGGYDYDWPTGTANWLKVRGSFAPPSVSYNSVTGTLTVTNGIAKSEVWSQDSSQQTVSGGTVVINKTIEPATIIMFKTF